MRVKNRIQNLLNSIKNRGSDKTVESLAGREEINFDKSSLTTTSKLASWRAQKSLEDNDGIVNKTKKFRKIANSLVLVTFMCTFYFGYKVFATTFAVIDRSGAQDALALQDSISPDQLNREGDGRVNILLLGIGGDGHEGADLSDVNQVISIDPFNDKASILAIPRDFYVPIPGYYTTRINAAHAFGERDNGSGPELAKRTVEQVLDIPIHYYARIDFNGFKKAVDAVGGVTIKIDEDLYDPSYPRDDMSGSDVFQLKAGKHDLNGSTALKVARCRKGTCGSDFGRADRQQKILVELKDKAMTVGTVSNPSKVSKLLDTVGGHVRTDMSLTILMKLVEIAEKLEAENVSPKSFVLNTDEDNYLGGAMIGGASVLVPRAGINDFTQIQSFVRGKLFRDGFLAKENAVITILNATSQTGLATSSKSYLESYGYRVGQIGDASAGVDATKTKLYKTSAKPTPFTRALLQKRLGVNVSSQTAPASLEFTKGSDFVLVLGSDYIQR